jgi:hypothetical protein
MQGEGYALVENSRKGLNFATHKTLNCTHTDTIKPENLCVLFLLPQAIGTKSTGKKARVCVCWRSSCFSLASSATQTETDSEIIFGESSTLLLSAVQVYARTQESIGHDP